jgi:ethanolamine transporter
MSVISIFVLVFSLLGAIDFLLGNKIGIGEEFKRAFSLFCPMALSMLGMLVVAPAIGVWLAPVFDGFYNAFGIDPSVIPASLFANDMGGMTLAQGICISGEIGDFNAFVVSSMLGCVISFTIPFSMGLVKKEQHKDLFLGLLCGIATVPIGCAVAGLICGLEPLPLLLDLLPLILIAAVIGVALFFVPRVCIACFRVFGMLMNALGVIGLVCAVFTFLTGIVISPYFDTFENGAFICANACVTLSGMLPAMYVLSKLLKRPLHFFGARVGINHVAALALLGTLVTNASTFGTADQMDRRGMVLNSAFAVSASFVFGSHLAFTMVFDKSYILPMIAGKLVSGVAALVLAYFVCRRETAARVPNPS